MEHFNKKLIIILCISFFLFIPRQSLLATDNFVSGYITTGETAGFNEADNNLARSLPGWISVIINTILSIVGTLFLILMIYGGFIWMNAKGNETETKKAQDIIRNAIIGIVVVFAAYAITIIIDDLWLQTSTTQSSTITEQNDYGNNP